jgi:hypothetical protein
MNFKKIKGNYRFNTFVTFRELFTIVFIIISIFGGLSPIVLELNNIISLLFVSVFAQTSHVEIDYNSLQVTNRGQIQGKVITMGAITTEKGHIIEKPIHITVKAIGIGQTTIHCLNIADNQHLVKTSQPFLATAQKNMAVNQNTAFTLQLNPNEGNVNCDKLSVITGSYTTFSNVQVGLLQ